MLVEAAFFAAGIFAGKFLTWVFKRTGPTDTNGKPYPFHWDCPAFGCTFHIDGNNEELIETVRSSHLSDYH